MNNHHPDVPIHLAEVDEHLNERDISSPAWGMLVIVNLVLAENYPPI